MNHFGEKLGPPPDPTPTVPHSQRSRLLSTDWEMWKRWEAPLCYPGWGMLCCSLALFWVARFGISFLLGHSACRVSLWLFLAFHGDLPLLPLAVWASQFEICTLLHLVWFLVTSLPGCSLLFCGEAKSPVFMEGNVTVRVMFLLVFSRAGFLLLNSKNVCVGDMFKGCLPVSIKEKHWTWSSKIQFCATTAINYWQLLICPGLV